MKNQTSELARRAAQSLLVACLVGLVAHTNAQTTLSGDHTVAGNLNVGTSATQGNLTITGKTGSAALPGLRVTGDGGVVFTGTYGVGSIPATGAGTRFMWYPKKAALRIGRILGSEWNDNQIGDDSIAFGPSTLASGQGSIAFTDSVADGVNAVAMSGSGASGEYSVGIAAGGAYGSYSVALAGAMAGGEMSAALCGGMTWGTGSVAIGEGTGALSYGSVVLGRFNEVNSGESDVTAVPTDSIFVIGCGTGNYQDPPAVRYRNAIVVRKNSDVEINGKIKISRQGDISMGEFAQ